MALRTDDQDQKLDPSQADYDSKFNDIRKAEEAGDFNAIANNYDKTADPSQENNNIERARQGEQNSWQQNYTGAKNNTGNGRFSFKKQGPIGVIITVIVTALVGGGAFFAGPALLLQQVSETFTGTARLNPQLTSMQKRTNIMLQSKFDGPVKGVCTPINLLCKYTRPSNRILTQMKKNGIVAYKNNVEVDITKGPFPNARPDELRWTNNAGQTKSIKAGELAKTALSNPEFAAALRTSYNPRFVSLADNVFKAVKTRFGLNGTDKTKGKNPDKIRQTLNEESVAETTDGIGEAAKNGEVSVMRKLFGDRITTLFENLAKAGKSGSAVGLVAGGVCMVSDVPGLITKTVRVYQMRQFIKYAAVFLVAAGAQRAGDGTAETASTLGSILTTQVNGKTAMDSFGMRNALFGDTNQNGDTKWQNYAPGAGVIAALGGVAAITSSPVKKDACNIATSPFVGTAVNVAAAPETLGLSLVAGAIAWGAGVAIGQFSGPIVNAFMNSNIIPDSFYQSLMGALVPDLTKDASGQDAGNILASGAENLMSQTANTGGNMPLNIKQAIAYNKVTQQVDLAYAQQDRAALSPLDGSNPNTALGSFVRQFMPYYGQMSSLSGLFSMIGSVTTGSFSSLLSASTVKAADPATEFNQCQDPSIQISQTAATPFCAIQYGVPPEYLAIDPTQVIQDLKDSGNIDDNGNAQDPSSVAVNNVSDSVFGIKPNSDTATLKQWQALCTDGSTDAISAYEGGNSCMITDRKTAEFALYTIDRRIQQTMDGEDTTLNSSSDNTTSTQAATYTPPTSPSVLLSALQSFNTSQPQVSLLQQTPEVVMTVSRFSLHQSPFTSIPGILV